MAFSNAVTSGGGFGGAGSPGSGIQVRDGSDLPEIQTDELGFSAINGETQLRLLSEPWPADALPPPTSSLLAVASSLGLVAAAGPNELVLVQTKAVRDAFRPIKDELEEEKKQKQGKDGQEKKIEKVRPVSPLIKLQQSRLAHVVFSADENVLVVSGQDGGGLAAFQVSKLLGGQTDSAFTISTNGASLRALIPNPAPETAHLFALVTSNGDLLMADLRQGQLQSGSNGSVLKSGVSCVSWSNKGKQLVAGLANGTVTQLKPDGSVVAEIPKSTSVPEGCHVSGITWLENDLFLIIYTPDDNSSGIEPSEYYIVSREPKTTNYEFQKLPELIPGFGVPRTPTFHFLARLRNFPPHIQDMLILTATTGSDIALVTKSDKPLSTENDSTGSFSLTIIAEDTRRAALPLSDDMQDTSPIGMALDLSSNEKVPNPIPSDIEIMETHGPVPNLLVLNHQGILVSWWVIYNDSVREKTLFSGFAGIGHNRQSQPSSPPMLQEPMMDEVSSDQPKPQTLFAGPTSTFGQPSLENTSPFTKPAAPLLASNTTQASSGSSFSTFGKASPIGGAKPSWTSTGFGGASQQSTTPGFGQSGFGSASAIGGSASPAFGASGVLGGRPNPFGQTAASGTSSFGQPSAFSAQGGGQGTNQNASPFGALSSGTQKSSGFAAFAAPNGLSGFGSNKTGESSSPFGAATGKSIFGQQSSSSPFAATKSSSFSFGKPAETPTVNPIQSGSGFKVESSFRADGTAKDDLPKPKQVTGFGLAGLGDLLNEPEKVLSPTHNKETEMDDGDDEADSPSNGSPTSEKEISMQSEPDTHSQRIPQNLVTPPATLTQPKTTPAPQVSNLFSFNKDSTTPATQPPAQTWSFGQVPSTTPKEAPAVSQAPLFGTVAQSKTTPAAVQKSEPMPVFGSIPNLQPKPSTYDNAPPKIKEEPPSDDEAVDLSGIPEAPLPPDPVSKPRFSSGDTSISSVAPPSPPLDAPLPPDFVPGNRSGKQSPAEPALPSDEEDELSSDFDEISGEEATEDASPAEDVSDDQTEHVQTSPESSFKGGERSLDASPTGGLFTKVSTTNTQKAPRALFGEVSGGPIFPPPKPHESPRSPSPVRNLLHTSSLRADTIRSSSMPARSSPIFGKQPEPKQAAPVKPLEQPTSNQTSNPRQFEASNKKSTTEPQVKDLDALEEDENDWMRIELEKPIEKIASLDDEYAFVTYQPKASNESKGPGIPAQIERLYQDINYMINTYGVNARRMTGYIKYQQEELNRSKDWPSSLNSTQPDKNVDNEWTLTEVPNLYEGLETLETAVGRVQVDNLSNKLLKCQQLLGHDLFELRTKLTAIRKTLSTKTDSSHAVTAPLSAEQASIQHDLRKASALVKVKLVQIEDQVSVLRAKIAEEQPRETTALKDGTISQHSSQKKPTVEAVTSTVAKMTAMAEKKSADIDVLEAQLKRFSLTIAQPHGQIGSPGNKPTPDKNHRSLIKPTTPGSQANSVYHTPDSRANGASGRSNKTSASRRSGDNSSTATAVVSTEDRERWQNKARRKKELASALKAVLEKRQKDGIAKN